MKDKAGTLSSNLYGMPWQSYTAFIGEGAEFLDGGNSMAALCAAQTYAAAVQVGGVERVGRLVPRAPRL